MADGGGGGGGASLGKGAWDCDAGKAIPPEAEAAVFEEVRVELRGAQGGRRASPSRSSCGRPANRPPTKTPNNNTTPQYHQQQKIATMDMPFEGIPTIPPPKDRARLAFFAGGCRYLVTADPRRDTVAEVKQRLFSGGIARAYPGEIASADDIELYYACVRMEVAEAKLEEYKVPPVSFARSGGWRRSGGRERRKKSSSSRVRHQNTTQKQGCKTMIALSTALMKRGLPPKESAYWH
jgi:hypothetical protein